MHLGKIGTDYCKILIDYNSQKIDDDEFSCRFLHTSMKLLGTKAMVAVGQLAILIPVVGAIIGNFVGRVMSKTLSENLRDALKEVKLARQNRIEIEKKCRENIRLLEMYRNQFKEVFERYFHGNMKFFNESFDELERALYAGDADLAIAVNNKSRTVRAELQKSIDENLEALRKITNSLFVAEFFANLNGSR